jgi:hypothetical protein
MSAPPLTFGIYPGMTGVETAGGIAPGPCPDDPARTNDAMDRLAPGRRFLVRSYLIYEGGDEPASSTPVDPAVYANSGRALDLVLCYRSTNGDVAEWRGFVRRMVARFGALADAIQVTEEPNNPQTATGGDGASPNVREAMIDGVIAAKEEARALRLPVGVGVAFAPSFNPSDDFWPDMARRITPDFLAALDYVGLDFFPDVFRPLPTPDVETAVEGVLTHFRDVNLRTGGIPASVPMRVTEHGWPTGAGRSHSRQADLLERVVRTIDRCREPFNITQYECFMLRDGDSRRPEMACQWGLLHHDYSPKPAFEVYRQLIAELGDTCPRHPPAATRTRAG